MSNAIRASQRARSAGLSVEVEKPGLLPQRPDEDGAELGARGAGLRRPADVWLAQWGLHGAAALDLAVTSGLRAGAVVGAGGQQPLLSGVRSAASLQGAQATARLPRQTVSCKASQSPYTVRMPGRSSAGCLLAWRMPLRLQSRDSLHLPLCLLHPLLPWPSSRLPAALHVQSAFSFPSVAERTVSSVQFQGEETLASS